MKAMRSGWVARSAAPSAPAVSPGFVAPGEQVSRPASVAIGMIAWPTDEL